VRTKETNVGDFVADSSRNWTLALLPTIPGFHNRSDSTSPVLAITNGGGLRWNADKPPGNITDGDILELLPFGSITNIIATTGLHLRLALEQSVSILPDPNGRFLQISGFNFSHACIIILHPFGGSCSKPVGSRVLSLTLPDGTPIEDDDTLFLAIPDFVQQGGDGYTMFVEDEVIVNSDSGLDQFTLVQTAIKTLEVISPMVEGRIIESG